MSSSDTSSVLPSPNDASPAPITNDGADSGGVNLALAVGIPVGVVGVIVIVLIVVLLLWKWKYKRKYSMNESSTPTKTLTYNEESLGNATPPGCPGLMNGNAASRPEILLRTPSREAELCVVRHYYAAQESDQLTLQTGRIVEVVEKNQDGWWRGSIEDSMGWFPANYVRKIEASEKVKYRQQSNQNTPEKKSASPIRLVKKNHHDTTKKTAPAVPNGTKPREVQQPQQECAVVTAATLETSVRSDTHQLLESSGEKDTRTHSVQDDEEAVTTQPRSVKLTTDIEAVDNEEKMEGFINEIFTVEDELTPRSSVTESESSPRTIDFSEVVEEPPQFREIHSEPSLVTDETFEKNPSNGPDITEEVLKDQSEISIQQKQAIKADTPSKPTPAKRNHAKVVLPGSGDPVTTEREQATGESSPSAILHSTPKRKTVADKKFETYVAMYPFTAVHREQLSLSPNDVIDSNGHLVNGWLKGNKRGETQEGWFPESYVREAHENGTESESKPAVSVDKSLSESEFSDVGDQSFEDELTGMAYRVIHPYSAKQDGDLDLNQGDLVVVLESLDNGWWRGVQAGREGWFPGSYVQVIPQTPMASKDVQNPFRTLPRNYKHGDLGKASGTDMSENKRSTLPAGLSPAAMLRQGEQEVDDYTEEDEVQTSKPAVPKRFVIPKLVKAHKNKSQKKRPVKPPPPAPPPAVPGSVSSDPVAPPRRSKRNSVSRPSVPPPRPPSDLDSSAGSGDFQSATYSPIHVKNDTPTSIDPVGDTAVNLYSDISDASMGDEVRNRGDFEKSFSPSLYGHNGTLDNSICRNGDHSQDTSLNESAQDQEVFENLVTSSPIDQTEGQIGRNGRNGYLNNDNSDGVYVDIDGSVASQNVRISSGKTSTNENGDQRRVNFSTFKQNEHSSDATSRNSANSDEPVYAVVQKKKKDLSEKKASSVALPSEVSEEIIVKSDSSPENMTCPLQDSLGKAKPVIGPKPPTPAARELFTQTPILTAHNNVERDNSQYELEERNNFKKEQQINLHHAPLPQTQNTNNVMNVSDSETNKSETQPPIDNTYNSELRIDSSEQHDSLLAEIMNSFEDLRTSIDSSSESLPAVDTGGSVLGHYDHVNDMSDNRELAQVHNESSSGFAENNTLPGIWSHKIHQEGHKSDLLPATFVQDPMEMGSEQQSVVYDSNQGVASSPSKAIIQDRPAIPAKPSISPKSLSSNLDMSSRSESSFERSYVTIDTSLNSTEDHLETDNYEGVSTPSDGLHPDSIRVSDLPDRLNDSDTTGNYSANTSDEPPPPPEGPPPESPLIQVKLPKPEKSVLAKALKAPNHDLIMTSPYVVIKTPTSENHELRNMDTEEVSMLTRSIEEPQTFGNRKSSSKTSEGEGLRKHISGLLDKILPDVFNPSEKLSESDLAAPHHPVNQIEFVDSFHFKKAYGLDDEQDMSKIHQNGNIQDEEYYHGKIEVNHNEEQSSDLSFVDDISEVSSSSTSPCTKPKSKRPAKPPRKSKSISSDEERSHMKQKMEELEASLSKSSKDYGLTKYQLPALRPPPVSDLTERYRRTSAGSVPSLGSTPPTSPDSPSPVKIESPRNHHLPSSTPNTYKHDIPHPEPAPIMMLDDDLDKQQSNVSLKDPDAIVTLYDVAENQSPVQILQDTVVSNVESKGKKRASDADSPLRFFTPSKFVAKPYTPSPQIMQRDASLTDSTLSDTDHSNNEIHFQIDQSVDNYSVKVLNSLNKPPLDDYRITGNASRVGPDARIIGFDTPKPFQKPGQLKKVTAPQSLPPKLIQCVEDDGRVYI